MSYVDEHKGETLVHFPFSPKPPEPEKIIIREVVREPEPNAREDSRIHPPCPLGREFDEWSHDNLLLDKDMDLLDVKRDIVLLTEQYRMYYKLADQKCRNHTTPNYHCIHHVLHEWLERLEKRERKLIPSKDLFFEPVESEDKPSKDMTLGESLDDEEQVEKENW